MNNLLFGVENISFFDSYWAAVHFGSGLLTGIGLIILYKYFGKKITAISYSRYGIILLIAWEYFELFLRYAERYEWSSKKFLATFVPESLFTIESLTNIMSDLILGSFGLFLIFQYFKMNSKKTRAPKL